MLTGKGLAVDLAYDWDLQDGVREGWTVHRLGARVEGVDAGYLKISYVPSRAAAIHLPDELHYAFLSGRHIALRRLLELAPESEWTAEQLRSAISSGNEWMSLDATQRVRAMSLSELRTEWLAVRARICARNAEAYEDFLEFHLDKPLVDYIRVFRGDEVPGDGPTARDWAQRPEGFQRQGIATALYQVGAKWMAANGLRLYASGLQSEEARDAWGRLAALHRVVTVPPHARGRSTEPRHFLDGAEIDVAQAPPAGT